MDDEADIYSVLELPRDSEVDAVDKAYFDLAFACAESTDPAAKARLSRATPIYTAWRATQPQAVSHGTDPATAKLFDGLFQQVFARGRTANRRGGDRALAIQIPYAEALAGCTRVVTVVRKSQCTRCGGTGGERGVLHVCAECRGTGMRPARPGEQPRPCGACNATGRFAASPCDSCESGLCEGHDTVTIAIPAGTANADVVRCTGKGDELFDAPPGDLLVTISVDMIGVLVPRGDDTVLETVVTLRHVWFGGSVEVATVDGTARVTVPRGVRDGDTTTLTGRGRVRATASPTSGDPYRDVPRGDQIIVFRIRRDRERVKLVVGGLVGAGLVVLGLALGL